MKLNRFDISGKLAVVTGSSKGIGYTLAKGLLEEGCRVVLNARSDTSLQQAVATLNEQIPDAAERLFTACFDVSDEQQVQQAVVAIERDIGPIDILVNNAGIQIRGPFTEYPKAQWDQLLNTNLTGTFLISREVAKAMSSRRRGKIINIASLQSEQSRPGIAPYAATKGAIKMLTKGMCADLAGQGIQVNALGPGYFATELNMKLKNDPTFDAWLVNRTPAGRWGDVADLVGTLVFLASPASDFVNGQIIYVDGGVLSVL